MRLEMLASLPGRGILQQGLNNIQYSSGELRCEIPVIVSNHPDLEGVAASFGVPFRCLPLAKGSGPEGKAAQVSSVCAVLHCVYSSGCMQLLQPYREHAPCTRSA